MISSHVTLKRISTKKKMAQADLFNTITNVLGLSVKQRGVSSSGRYDKICTIIHLNYKKIRECCTNKSKLKNTRGGSSYGYRKIKLLQVLEWWATNFILRGKRIVLADVYATMMTDCIDEEK